MRVIHQPATAKVRVPPQTEEVVFLTEKDSKVKKWAFKNAYMLIFLSSMFVITWVVFVIADYYFNR